MYFATDDTSSSPHVSMQMVLFEKAQFSGQAYEIYRDVADATSLQLSPLVSVKVIRGWYVELEQKTVLF